MTKVVINASSQIHNIELYHYILENLFITNKMEPNTNIYLIELDWTKIFFSHPSHLRTDPLSKSIYYKYILLQVFLM